MSDSDEVQLYQVEDDENTFIVLSLGEKCNGIKLNKQSIVYLNLHDGGLEIKSASLKLMCKNKIINNDDVQKIKSNISYEYYQNQATIINPVQILNKFKALLQFDQEESIFFKEFLKHSGLIFSSKQSSQQRVKKLSNDITRTTNLPFSLNKQTSAQFQNLSLLTFISEENQYLNQLLYTKNIDINYQLDCILVFKITQTISHFLKHFQQGYCDIITVFLNLLLDVLILQNDIQDQDHLFDFLSEICQLSFKFIKLMEQNLSIFNSDSTLIVSQFEEIKSKFVQKSKKFERKFVKCFLEMDLDMIVLFSMEQILSLFSRSGNLNSILAIWEKLILNCELDSILELILEKIYAQCKKEFGSAKVWKIDCMEKFLFRLKE